MDGAPLRHLLPYRCYLLAQELSDTALMRDSNLRLRAFTEEYLKLAAEKATLSEAVYRDVAKKYPQLLKPTAEAEKKAGFLGSVGNKAKGLARHLEHHEDAYELGGLGVLGAIGVDRLQAHARAGAGANNHAIEKKQLLGESGHAALDTAGLATLAAPIVAKKFLGR